MIHSRLLPLSRRARTAFLSLPGLVLVVLVSAVLVSAVQGCADSSIQCLGTAVACDSRELAECNQGCRVQEGCFGGAVSCESLSDRPNLCIQADGCRYVGSCEGAEGCDALSFADCEGAAGCQQVRRCFGNDFACESLEDSQCELFAQCDRSSRCVGSADSCDALPSSIACLDVPGCFPADTKPSVVD